MGVSTMFSKVHQAPVTQEELLQSPHQERSYECKVCDKKFFYNPNYIEHKKENPEHTFSKKVWDDNL